MKISIYLLIISYLYIQPLVAPAQPIGCGQPIPTPTLRAERKQQLESDLNTALAQYNRQPNADGLIWVARRFGYLGQYDSAMAWLNKGILQYPTNAWMYRHRGHRYITLRCFDKAIADFENAAALVKGKPDEVEQDGQPNEANIPTSTLQTNIFYHLGLAHYLQKNYVAAIAAWTTCLQLSANADMKTATTNWLYLTLRMDNKNEQAQQLLLATDFNSPLLENEVYRKILLLHKNKPTAAEVLQTTSTAGGGVASATYLYGLMMYLKLNGHHREVQQVKAQLLHSAEAGSFGFIAAEYNF